MVVPRPKNATSYCSATSVKVKTMSTLMSRLRFMKVKQFGKRDNYGKE